MRKIITRERGNKSYFSQEENKRQTEAASRKSNRSQVLSKWTSHLLSLLQASKNLNTFGCLGVTL